MLQRMRLLCQIVSFYRLQLLCLSLVVCVACPLGGRYGDYAPATYELELYGLVATVFVASRREKVAVRISTSCEGSATNLIGCTIP